MDEERYTMVDGGRTSVRSSGGASAHGRLSLANSGVINGSVHLAERRVAMSGYLTQVEAISAADFRGRESELSEMAAFCTAADGTEVSADPGAGYWRWLAPAWTGKSALLAHFVLHPPPGTDLVAFFITSRLARQNDAAAFCEVVQRQLYALLDEEEPLTTPYTRDEQLRLAMNRAAELSASRGRRLVLVVDGLDEDRGVTPGPDCHGIAALLPRVLPHGMRVVVAGRPHPPVPGDVPGNHPLRTREIDHWLERSEHAQAARWDAEQDLLRVLDGDGLGRDLVGLTVAAGGGLSAPDLAELTGSRQRLVERELSAVTGRSFRRRTAHWEAAGPGVYLLAHEEIQRSAAELVTDEELAEYRSRLHRWARRYQEAGWPPETPEYLLRGYTQVLREAGEVERLVALVCDAGRQERLWQVTGADLEALGEIAAVFDQLVGGSHSADQGVEAALRLADARDQLHARSAGLPPELIALWARLGHVERAVSMAHSRRERYDRVRALSAIAGVLAAAGAPDEGFALAEGFDRPGEVDRFMEAISIGLAKSGRHDLAIRTARRVQDAASRAQALVAAVEEHAKTYPIDKEKDTTAPPAVSGATPLAPDTAEIVATVEEAHDQITAAVFYAALAAARSRLGDDRQARELLEREGAAHASLTTAFQQAQARALAARHLATAPRLAVQASDAALLSAKAALTLDDPVDMRWVLPIVARGLAATGHLDRARSLVDRLLGQGVDGDEAMSQIGVAIAETGDLDTAVVVGEEISSPIRRMRVINAVGAAAARSGDVSRVLAQHQQSLSAVRNVSGPGWPTQLLVETADFLHQADCDDQALAVVALATDLARGWSNGVRQGNLVEIVRVAELHGQPDVAQRLVQSLHRMAAEFGPHEIETLTAVAQGMYHVGRREEAEGLLDELVPRVSEHMDEDERFDVLADIAELLGEMGSAEAAREVARDILRQAHVLTSSSRRSWARSSAARAFLAAGDAETAMEVTRTLPGHEVSEIHSYAVDRLVGRGEGDSALRIAEAIDDTRLRERALATVAQGFAAAGDVGRARQLLDRVSASDVREAAAPALVGAISRAGAYEEARRAADAVTDPARRSRTLAALAQSLGATARGRALLVEALALGPWDRLVAEIADVVPEHLPWMADPVLGEE
ncbi:hypothetical protein [Streptomyces sp. NPDC046887]|uniref:hypothetical protein n=1 Tax=Streptomyces sp. NPDC046887 TaxID=3155472 RepID=UPI0033C4B6B9